MNMKKSKQLKNEKTKNIKINIPNTDDENVIKKLIIIIAVIVVVAAVVYATTELLGKKETETNEPGVIAGEINYDKVSVGTILNRADAHYYVMVYNGEEADAMLYSTILTKYAAKEDSLKIYYCDLNNKLNSSYYNVNNDNVSNTNPKKTEEFDFGDITLLEIKNGKITKYLEDLEAIKKQLA